MLHLLLAYVIIFYLVIILYSACYRYLNSIHLKKNATMHVIFYASAVISFVLASSLYHPYYLTFVDVNDLSTTLDVFCIYWPFVYVFAFVTPLTLVFCFIYNKNELRQFTIYITAILFLGFLLFSVNSIFLFFIIYEAFLIPSFLTLYSFAKTRKAVEAAYLMFFWTQFGALFLILNFQYLFFISNISMFSSFAELSFSPAESHFLFLTLLIGFGVKFPIWPFYDWLPKAHVEASTNFSIFLSGVLVKFAFFGFLKYLTSLSIDIIPFWFYPFIFVGFLDSSLKLYYQIDLKKVIAYSTVIEMHWLTIAVVNGNSFFWISGFAMMISHALLSSNFFLLIDSITRRFKTRILPEISGIIFYLPSLYFVTLTLLVLFLGFPGTLFFIAEVIFFSALLDFNFLLFLIFFFFAYFFVPSVFFKKWFLILFGNSEVISQQSTPDLNRFEFVLFWFFILVLFWFGLTFQFL